MSKTSFTLGAVAATATMAIALGAAPQDLSQLRGSIKIDGSSTVYPITEAVAEEFSTLTKDKVRVTVGISGTGGGFKRFTVGETDISDASRPIKDKEYNAAKENEVNFIELPVAYDGLTIVVHPKNAWVSDLTIDDLKKIFLEDHAAKRWSDVRPNWPDHKITIYAPGTDSGTFDYFKEVIAGDTGSIRSDMSVSEDDNVLVRGVSGDENAIGFFGFAYYEENQNKLKAVPIVNPDSGKAVAPAMTTIENGDYAPFSRPLFIYVSEKSSQRPEVEAFVKFYLEHAPKLVKEVGYVPLPKSVYAKAMTNFEKRKTGTQFLNAEGEKLHGPVTKLYK